MDQPLTILDVFGVEPFTPAHNALKGLEGSARTVIQHPEQSEFHEAGLARAEGFLKEHLAQRR